MKVICRTFSLLALCSASAVAQKSNPIEIGFDASLASVTRHFPNLTGNAGRPTETATVLQFPIQAVRVGFPVSDRVSIEPSLGLLNVHNDGASFSGYDARIALLVAPSGNRREAQWFVRPFVGIAHNWQLFDGSHAALGAGAGVRIPVTERIASRIEGRYTYYTEDLGLRGHELGLYLGLSFFTH